MNYHETQHAGSARLLQTVAVVSAAFAAIGVTIGVREANVHDGWLVPVAAGIAVAILFGAFWHVLIGSAAHVRRAAGVVGVVAAGIILAVLAVGVSAQSIATAMAGKSAVRAELAKQVPTYVDALNLAHEEAIWFRPLIDTASTSAAGYMAMADQEAAGSLGSGAGCGVRCAEMQSFAGSFQRAADGLSSMAKSADSYRKDGEEAVKQMRNAVSTADQELFLAASIATTESVSNLNAVDPTPIISSTGVVTVDSSQEVNLDDQTAKFHSQAETLGADRDKIEVPVFVPTTVFEATRHQMTGAAAYGWVAAVGIDILPLFFLLVVLLTSSDPLLRNAPRSVSKARATEHNAKIREDEEDISRGGGSVPIGQLMVAAE